MAATERPIIADLKDSYGITCENITPVTGGHMNLKWKVTHGAQDYLVKQFSNKRYRRDKLTAVEAALRRQIILHGEGIPCPRVLQINGNPIRFMDGGIAYMVMTFCPGRIETPYTITAPQMRDLGSVCGRMHNAFAKLPVDSSVKGYPIDSGRLMESLWRNYHERIERFSSDDFPGYQEAALALKPILNQLTAGFFDRLPKGIAHEDFSPDNMLFEGDHISAILDFDRGQYSFLLHDIGRAILSLALRDGDMNMDIVRAFAEGYSAHSRLTLPDIADALRLTLCMENQWWIQPEFFGENHAKVLRFRDEMLWLIKHWDEIDSIILS